MPDVVLLPFALIADTMRRWSDAHREDPWQPSALTTAPQACVS
jgi:hypothetical protein